MDTGFLSTEVSENKSVHKNLEGSQETILVIEDDVVVRQVLETYLSNKGYVVKTSSSAEEALNFCKKESVSLIICATRCSRIYP